MTIAQDIQSLDPGPLIEFYEWDGTMFEGGSILRFHGQGNYTLYWDGEEYAPWPIASSGFERTGLQQPSPKLQVGNIDGSISALCLMFDDMVGSTIIRHRTFKKYLDAANFEDGNPDADPSQEFPPEVWIVDRKSNENCDQVDFDLASALDFGGVTLPGRDIMANLCAWIIIGGYRGPYCGYAGPPVADRMDNPTSDPDLDRCGGRISSCKLRFTKLNFGSFPAAGMLRT